MNQMEFDFDGLIKLLADHLYSEKKVFIRELIQNGHDAIQRRIAHDKSFSYETGKIKIYTEIRQSSAIIRFIDNGVGMTRDELIQYLSNVGSSGTREKKEEVPDTIGQFGIGFLSGFVVAEKITVKTKSYKGKKAWLWENNGTRNYKLEACEKDDVGTEVIIYINNAEYFSLIKEKMVKEVIHKYADMLKIPIHLNSSEYSINNRIMPWEKKDLTLNEILIDSRIYLERNMPDSVLEVIPIQGNDDIDVSGVLYITRTRVIGRDTPRVIRVYQKRMFLCENTPEILPKWATFVNGIINTSDLKPNAARDNFQRDEKFEKLRDYLGKIIIKFFEELSKNNRDRLSEILAYHDLGIKAACYYYDTFFNKFGHLIEWKVNNKSPASKGNNKLLNQYDQLNNYKWATLPDIIEVLPEKNGIKRLYCFTTSLSENQFFDLANASGITVVDASQAFESELIKTWAKNHPEIRISYIDQEDDLDIFKNIDKNVDYKIQQLANQMSLLLRPGGVQVNVEARIFQPNSLPAMLKNPKETESLQKAKEVLNDPNTSSSLKSMAEETLRLASRTDLKMFINASNKLIREISSLDNYDDPDVVDIILGIYNDAVLYSQKMMTANNAKVFHEQYGKMLTRSVEYVKQRKELEQYKSKFQKQTNIYQKNRKHLIGFYITPYRDDFKQVHSAVRDIVEDKFKCQLVRADQITYDALIGGNVKRHIDDADFYIVDVTGANPNVMQELGAVHYGKSDSPVILIAGIENENDKIDLPADLAGYITAPYTKTAKSTEIFEKLSIEFTKNIKLTNLLKDGKIEEYISPIRLSKCIGAIVNDEMCKKLSLNFPTKSCWQNLDEDKLKDILGEASDLIDPITSRIEKKC